MRTTLCIALILLPATAFADWLVLNDGSQIRGIDLKLTRDGFLFTLEDGRRVLFPEADVRGLRPAPEGETVEFRGEQVTLEEKIETLQKEAKKRAKELQKALDRWGRAYGEADDELSKREREARDLVLAATEEEQVALFCERLREASSKDVRSRCAEQLARFETPESVHNLARSLVVDSSGQTRSVCLEALEGFADKEAPAATFVRYLDNDEPDHRIRAAAALGHFPNFAAVPAMIQTLRMVWSGFGQNFVQFTKEEAYVADYDVQAESFGNAAVEIADPVIGVLRSGISLEAKVQRVEAYIRVETLRRVTGQNFGLDQQAWADWYRNREED